jgi:P22_AR N-terminal domain
LGIKTQRQVEKLSVRNWAKGRVHQRCVTLPGGTIQRGVWMIDRAALGGWLFTIHENNVAEDKREGLQLLQLELSEAMASYLFKVYVENRPSEMMEKALQSITTTNVELFKCLFEERAERERQSKETAQKFARIKQELHEDISLVRREMRALVAHAPLNSNIIQIMPEMRSRGGGVWQSTTNSNVVMMTGEYFYEKAKTYFQWLVKMWKQPKLKDYIRFISILKQPARCPMPTDHGSRLSTPPGTFPPSQSWLYSEKFWPMVVDGYQCFFNLACTPWRKHERTFNGKKLDVFYPKFEEARKELRAWNCEPKEIEIRIADFVQRMPIIGEDVEMLRQR